MCIYKNTNVRLNILIIKNHVYVCVYVLYVCVCACLICAPALTVSTVSSHLGDEFSQEPRHPQITIKFYLENFLNKV